MSDYEHEVLIRSRPRWRFGYFAAAGKVTRRPQTAESPCDERSNPIIAPSSVWPSASHLPPEGEGFFGEPPLAAPGKDLGRRAAQCAAPTRKAAKRYI